MRSAILASLKGSFCQPRAQLAEPWVTIEPRPSALKGPFMHLWSVMRSNLLRRCAGIGYVASG